MEQPKQKKNQFYCKQTQTIIHTTNTVNTQKLWLIDYLKYRLSLVLPKLKNSIFRLKQVMLAKDNVPLGTYSQILCSIRVLVNLTTKSLYLGWKVLTFNYELICTQMTFGCLVWRISFSDCAKLSKADKWTPLSISIILTTSSSKTPKSCWTLLGENFQNYYDYFYLNRVLMNL